MLSRKKRTNMDEKKLRQMKYPKVKKKKKMNKEEFQTKKNDIDSKIRELKNQKIQLEKEYIESNQGFPVGSKVCITVPAHERYILGTMKGHWSPKRRS